MDEIITVGEVRVSRAIYFAIFHQSRAYIFLSPSHCPQRHSSIPLLPQRYPTNPSPQSPPSNHEIHLPSTRPHGISGSPCRTPTCRHRQSRWPLHHWVICTWLHQTCQWVNSSHLHKTI